MLTYDQVVEDFQESILPFIVQRYEQDGVRDVPARCEEWNNYTDALCQEGLITPEEYDLWEAPGFCDYE